MAGSLVVALASYDSAPKIAAPAFALLAPGNWVASEWGNMHSASFPLLLVFANLAFYYALILATVRLKARLGLRRAHHAPYDSG